MITKFFHKWLPWKWSTGISPELRNSFHATFGSLHGQQVMYYLLDSVYCTVYEGTDLYQMAAHNARRALVHEILEILDQAEHPQKYEIPFHPEEFTVGQGV